MVVIFRLVFLTKVETTYRTIPYHFYTLTKLYLSGKQWENRHVIEMLTEELSHGLYILKKKLATFFKWFLYGLLSPLWCKFLYLSKLLF